MNERRRHLVILAIASALGMEVTFTSAQDTRPINFADHIAPIIDEYCLGCHRGSRARNGLKLDRAAGLFEGGSSGTTVVPGDPDASLLYQVVKRTREPFMPYEEDPLPKDMVETIRQWIEGGALESASSKPRIVDSPKIDLSIEPAQNNRPTGELVMPSGLRLDPYWWSTRANTITAMGASPWAPVIAVSGHRQVVLYHTDTLELLGVLEYPEGIVNSLRFSRNGAVLIAGGGQSARHGQVTGWDVRTGRRLFDIGDEPDAVLAADLTNDHRRLALGGSDRIVRVYAIETGELLYEITKHTDWVTALSFSPDGVLLVTGDRSGGLFVWEADTGREFHTLPLHQGRVTDVSWRSDSNVLASGGEDGAIRLYEMENGRQIKAWSSHGGVLSIQYAPDGRLVTSGRDRLTRLWDANGTQLMQFEAMPGIATQVAVSHDTGRVFVGDWGGEVAVFDIGSSAKVGRLRANPTTQVHLASLNAVVQVETLTGQLARYEQRVNEAKQALASRTDEANEAEQTAQQAEENASNAESQAGELGAQAERARQGTQPMEAAMATKRLVRVETAGQLETARHEYEVASSEMQTVLQASLDAEKTLIEADDASRDAAGRRVEQTRKMLEGVVALTQMAASKVAELEVQLVRWDAEVSDWLKFVQPKLEEVARLAQAAREAQTLMASLRQEAVQARQVADEQASVLTSLQVQLDTDRVEFEAATEALERARLTVGVANAHWEAQHAAIIEGGGRVPVDKP